MSWNVSLNLSNLFQAVKLLQSTCITNPISANLNLNNFAITGAPIIQGGIAGGGPTLQTYTGTTALTIDNSANITGTVSITTPTLTVSSGGLIRLNGNSSTSSLQMSNSTGVLILLNNSNSTSYEVPVGAVHSFKVNTVETAKVDSTGITTPTLFSSSITSTSGALNLTASTNNITYTGNNHYFNVGSEFSLAVISSTGLTLSATKILTTPTITFSGDGSSQTTANDVYINGTTTNTAYPVACVGQNTTGRTSLYTDGVGHITYNPSTNLLNITNNGKLTLVGTSSLATLPTITSNTLQHSTASDLTITNTGAGNVVYRAITGQKHSFEVVSGTEIAKIDSSGLNIAIDKSLYLNGYAGAGASLSYANLTGIFTLNNPVGENIFNVPSSGFNSFRTNNTQVLDIDSTGLYVYPSKTITLNGNSLTSTLSMNNSTGLLTLANNSNSNSYKVPTGQKHSFLVNNVETANIDSGGLNLPSGFDLGLKQITSGLFRGAIYFGSRNNGWSVGSNNISQMFVSNTTDGSTFNGVYMDSTSTSWSSLSDIKLKQDVSTLQSNLEKIIALRPVSFKWISNPTFINHGFIANEVKEIIPEIVSNVGEYLGMNQQGIIPFLVGAVKEQQVQIQAQQTQINDLKSQLNTLLGKLGMIII
jgi:hypothetical protein